MQACLGQLRGQPEERPIHFLLFAPGHPQTSTLARVICSLQLWSSLCASSSGASETCQPRRGQGGPPERLPAHLSASRGLAFSAVQG